MSSSGRALGFMAGFAMAFAGYGFLAFVTNVSMWNLAEQSSYIGGITVKSEAADEPERLERMECSSGTWDCNRSAVSPCLGFFALIAVALMAGATASRVGEPASAVRAGGAVFAGALGFGAWVIAASRPAPLYWPHVLAWLMFALAAGILGSAGGIIVKKFR